jgi:hypothetical protein
LAGKEAAMKNPSRQTRRDEPRIKRYERREKDKTTFALVPDYKFFLFNGSFYINVPDPYDEEYVVTLRVGGIDRVKYQYPKVLLHDPDIEFGDDDIVLLTRYEQQLPHRAEGYYGRWGVVFVVDEQKNIKPHACNGA